MSRDGADIIDLGPESTHPDSEDVPPAEQIARLRPVMEQLAAKKVTISVDASHPDVVAAALELGADFINDVTGLANDETIDVIAPSECRVILMHSISAAARAERRESDVETIIPRIREFFEARLNHAAERGIARERIILDPGLGFFIGTNPQVSFRVLQQLDQLRSFGCPLLIGASRKSFLGVALADENGPRPVDQRGAASLAAELFTANAGVEFIRTHDVCALRDGLTVFQSIRDA